MRWATVRLSSPNQPSSAGGRSCSSAAHSPYSGGGSSGVSRRPTTPASRVVNCGGCGGSGVAAGPAGRSAPNIVTSAASPEQRRATSGWAAAAKMRRRPSAGGACSGPCRRSAIDSMSSATAVANSQKWYIGSSMRRSTVVEVPRRARARRRIGSPPEPTLHAVVERRNDGGEVAGVRLQEPGADEAAEVAVGIERRGRCRRQRALLFEDLPVGPRPRVGEVGQLPAGVGRRAIPSTGSGAPGWSETVTPSVVSTTMSTHHGRSRSPRRLRRREHPREVGRVEVDRRRGSWARSRWRRPPDRCAARRGGRCR